MPDRLHPVYEPFVKRVVDSCLTDLLVGMFDHRFPWQNKLATRKWSMLIANKKYESIRLEADTIYSTFEQRLLYTPLVQSVYGGLSLTYSEYGRLVTFTVTDKGTSYTFTDQGVTSPAIPIDWKLYVQTLQTLVDFLNQELDLEFTETIRAGDGSVDKGRDRSREVNGS